MNLISFLSVQLKATLVYETWVEHVDFIVSATVLSRSQRKFLEEY
jgi:hypothetical protein